MIPPTRRKPKTQPSGLHDATLDDPAKTPAKAPAKTHARKKAQTKKVFPNGSLEMSFQIPSKCTCWYHNPELNAVVLLWLSDFSPEKATAAPTPSPFKPQGKRKKAARACNNVFDTEAVIPEPERLVNTDSRVVNPPAPSMTA